MTATPAPQAAPPQAEARTAPKRRGGRPSRNARTHLLDAAEQLFGQHGIAGVSLREIASAAGQRNNSAVHYHFQDKQGLLDALIADRIAKVEQLRQALIDEAGDLNDCDTASLLRMLWQPMLDMCADRGGNWFIQFHLSYHFSYQGAPGRVHPIVADPGHHPASGLLLKALEARAAHLHAEQFRYRLGLLFMMFWAAVSQHDQAVISTNERWSSRFSLDETVKVAVAGLAAPA